MRKRCMFYHIGKKTEMLKGFLIIEGAWVWVIVKNKESVKNFQFMVFKKNFYSHTVKKLQF